VPAAYSALRSNLTRWIAEARAAGLDEESIRALVAEALHSVRSEAAA
jgi:hypothetical protein